MGAKSDDSEQLFNRNLTALVAVIFLFYGGLSCLYSTFIPHLIKLGFDTHEISWMLTIVALVSILGPLIFAPLIDLIADRYKGQFGRYLQYILAFLLIFGAIAYSYLLVIPGFHRTPTKEPSITFGCDANSSVIFQHRCNNMTSHCHYWDDEKLGELELVNCSYTCQNPEKYEIYQNDHWAPRQPSESDAQRYVEAQSSKEEKDMDYDVNDVDDVPGKAKQDRRQRRDIKNKDEPPKINPAHICTPTQYNSSIIERCQVYTNDIKSIKVKAKLKSALEPEKENATSAYCRYPIGKCFILPIEIHPKSA